MNYQPFHMSRIGETHVRRGLICQDASASEIYRNVSIAVVADGHGNRRHFRSDRGAVIACQIALEKICAFLDECDRDNRPMDDRLTVLKQAVCDAWIAAVREDNKNEPWTEDELDEERNLLTEEQFEALIDGSDVPIAYGSTLCAVMAYDGGWAAIQLGDGCFVLIGENGMYDWPMPESMFNEGNQTASLCMREPMRDFRHCWGTDQPAGLLVYTDGIEKTFPAQGKEVVSLLHWIWRNEYSAAPAREDNLARTLDMLTQRSAIGDDVSVAGIVDTEAEDKEPVLGLRQLQRELERLTAQIAEIEGTIQYNEARMRAARGNEEDVRSGAVEQLQKVIERKQTAALELQEQANRIRTKLGESEMELRTRLKTEDDQEQDVESVENPKAEPIFVALGDGADEQDKRQVRDPLEDVFGIPKSVARRFLRRKGE